MKSKNLTAAITHLFLWDRFILFLIITDAVLIFSSGYNLGSHNNFVLSLIEDVISLLFVVELLIKLCYFGRSYFKSKWNVLDFLLIILSLPSLLTVILNLECTEVSYLLVFRVLRVFKSFRFIRFVPGLKHLIMGVKRALRASVIILFGFVIYIFVVGILSFYLFSDCCPEFFRTPLLSLYSIFRIFTIEGWFEVPDKVAIMLPPFVSFLVYIYFIFIVMSGGVFGLSLVNSIFVDAMISDNNNDLEEKVDRLDRKIDQIMKHIQTK